MYEHPKTAPVPRTGRAIAARSAAVNRRRIARSSGMQQACARFRRVHIVYIISRQKHILPQPHRRRGGVGGSVQSSKLLDPPIASVRSKSQDKGVCAAFARSGLNSVVDVKVDGELKFPGDDELVAARYGYRRQPIVPHRSKTTRPEQAACGCPLHHKRIRVAGAGKCRRRHARVKT